MQSMLKTKTCLSCSSEQPASAFFPSAASPDGLTLRCRTCVLSDWQRERQRREARLKEAKQRARRKQRARPPARRVRFGEA